MRAKVKIFSAAFIFIFAALQVQPLFENYGQKKAFTNTKEKATTCAMKMESSCSMKMKSCANEKQTDPLQCPKKNDCPNNGCNPFMSCNMGFCCYVVENIIHYTFSLDESRQLLAHLNDNRLSGNISECWHPPEMIS